MMTSKSVVFSFPHQILTGSALAGLRLSRSASSAAVAPVRELHQRFRPPALNITNAVVEVWQTGVKMCFAASLFSASTRLVYYVVDTHICSVAIELNLHIDYLGQESTWHPLHPQVGPLTGHFARPRPPSKAVVTTSLGIHTVNGTVLRGPWPGPGTSVPYCTKPTPVCRQS